MRSVTSLLRSQAVEHGLRRDFKALTRRLRFRERKDQCFPKAARFSRKPCATSHGSSPRETATDMRRNMLGSSDLEVSQVCYGTMTFGKQNTEQEAFELLDYAFEQGVNFLDTAEAYPVPPGPQTYGQTEAIIGRWLKSRGCRDKMIIATKVSGRGPQWISASRSTPPNPDAPETCLSAEQIKDACHASMKRLGVDTIELYQLHWPDRYVPSFGSCQYHLDRERLSVPFEEMVAAVGKLIEAGKIRHWGVSNESTFGVCQLCETAKNLGVPLPVSIQNDFSLVDRRFEGELAEACSPWNYNLGLIPYGPLAGGTLTGKYFHGQRPDGARHTLFPGMQPRYHAPPTMKAAESYADLAQSKGLSPTQLALAWCKSRWYIPSTIIGATNLQQLQEDLKAFAVDLDDDTLRAIDAVHIRERNPNVID